MESECDQAVLAWADAARELTIPLMKSSVADDDVDDVAVRAGRLYWNRKSVTVIQYNLITP